jgi:hypothetical protein
MSHRDTALRVEAWVVSLALVTAALIWLALISLLWGDR